jgi:phospholipid/cholesterol/gamma-HCH transport system substrate-binding protein
MGMMKKGYTEVIVGLFMIAGFGAFVYLSLQLGEFSVFSLEKNYTIIAQFENVSGLRQGAMVEISGVQVGKVAQVTLDQDGLAMVSMLINKDVAIGEDAIASIRTQGIIGDKYIKIINGSMDAPLQNNEMIMDTESAIDIEELVSKYIFGGV